MTLLKINLVVSASYYEGYSNTICETILLNKILWYQSAQGNSEIFGEYFSKFGYSLSDNENKTIDKMIKKFNEIKNNKKLYEEYLSKLGSKLFERHNSSKYLMNTKY